MATPSNIGPANTQSAYLSPEIQVSTDPTTMNELIAKRERITATCLNLREIAQYEPVELVNGQQWFSTSPVNQVSAKRYAFRITFDLVAMNLAEFASPVIGAGATTLTLTTSTVPRTINIPTKIDPTRGYGSCTNATNFYFMDDPLVFVRTNIWTNASQTITITNNTGSDLTQAYWVFEYIKT